MNNVPTPRTVTPIDDLFTEKWFAQEFSLVTGLYYLIYDGQWRCLFSSDNCFQILKCTGSDFLERFQNLAAYTAYKAPKTTVGAMLQELTITPKPCSFISILPRENGRLQYIKGTLAVSHNPDGLLCVHGQITDVSGERENDVYLQDIEEVYRSSLHMSGRSIYRYQIEGRRGIIPPEIARRVGIPEVIDQLPEWDVACGRIAPQSVGTWLGIFDAIDRGEKQGAADVLFQLRNGRGLRRCRVEFISVTDASGKPVSAVISHRDVTEEYEQNHRQLLDRAGLLQISQIAFPEIVSMNLTKGTYRLVQCCDTSSLRVPPEGPLEQMLLLCLENTAPEDQAAFQDLFFPDGQLKAIREGRQQMQLTYRRRSTGGRWHWMESIVMHQDNPCDDDILTLAASRRIDQQKEQEELWLHMEKELAATENIFNLVAQHSDRTLYAYDLESGTTRPWNVENQKKDILAHLYEGNYSDGALDLNQFVLPDCIADVKQFFSDIHSGKSSGEVNVHLKLLDGQLRWYHFKYSGIHDSSRPATALISITDVTERHAQEVAYQRHVQSLEFESDGYLMYIESDLTADSIEKLTGIMMLDEERDFQCSHSDFGRLMLDMKFRFEDTEEAARYFSCANLLELYSHGVRNDRKKWQVRYSDGSTHWLNTETELMADPYNGHVKAFFRMTDITKEQQERLETVRRADFDAMTGLLRREEGEERIRQHLAADHEKGGILILLDLDDLKGINDNLGHIEGDAAIIGISKTLKSHFRRDDVLIRAGGDEFIVFLPGAGQGVSAVELSMTALLRKLSGISIGENSARTIHCSAGCAVELPGSDTYDTLFKRADTALYHVKRSGKNNFAFYQPEMSQADYEFQSKKLLSMQNQKKFELAELQYLLSAIASFYQLVLSVNLSANTYYLMEEVKGGVFSRVSTFGVLDDFIKMAAVPIHPDDAAGYFSHLSRNALLQAYEQGRENVRHHFRFRDQDNYRRIECIVIFYTNEQGDVCDFTMLRWAD